MNKDKFFIYGGVAKAGSTWLYQMLKQHPEAEMPIIKEIRYFFMQREVGKVTLWKKLFGKEWWLKRRREEVVEKISKQKNVTDKFDFLRYFFSTWSENWYKNLFSNDKLSGDVSPQYSWLEDEYIKKIQRFNPKAKIIIGLRNPIEKEWSHIKMVHIKFEDKKSISEVDETKLKNRIYNKERIEHNNYSTIVGRWQKYFPDEQILIYYYEELKENPQKLYDKICDFLGIKKVKIKNINDRINKGNKEKIPKNYRKMLVDANGENITKFAENYPNEFSLKWEKSIML